MRDWFVYLIRMRSGALYTGVTCDVPRRLAEHQGGGIKAAKALRGRGPLELAFQYAVDNQSEALQLEARIKKWSKQKKEALIAGDTALLKSCGDLP